MRLWVIKIGTSLLVDETGNPRRDFFFWLAEEIKFLQENNISVVIVSSGAIGLGWRHLGILKSPTDITAKQAAAAIGQPILMETYRQAMATQKIKVAQALLTREDFSNRQAYLNLRRTILELLQHNILPIINENDTIATAEIKFGDNDTLAIMVATKLSAEKLIILTDVPGLCEFVPGQAPKVIPRVQKITKEIEQLAEHRPGKSGTGGMKTKLAAARIALLSGISMYISSPQDREVLRRILNGENVGTCFLSKRNFSSRQLWIAFAALISGRLGIDNGAAQALTSRPVSLLPAGIVRVEGNFRSGAVVEIYNASNNQPLGKGIVNFPSDVLEKIKGKHSREISRLLNTTRTEAIHRDNMIIW